MKSNKLLIGSIISSVVCIGLVSCASIISGTKAKVILNGSVDEPVNIQTDYKVYERQMLPTTVKVKRGKKDSKIEITSENYMFEDVLVDKKINGWVWANFVFGGIVGACIDAADGAAWKPKEKSHYVVATKKKQTSEQNKEIGLRTENSISGDRLDNVTNGTTQRISDTEQKAESNSFPLFLDNYIAEWEKKGEFETTAQWKHRISEENKKEVLPELTSKAKKLYIAKEVEKVRSSVRLGRYDADNEIFEILTDVKTVYADVPLSVAPMFKKNWNKVEKQFEYDIVDGKLFIKSALFKYDGNDYRSVKVIKEQNIQPTVSGVDLNGDSSHISSTEINLIQEMVDKTSVSQQNQFVGNTNDLSESGKSTSASTLMGLTGVIAENVFTEGGETVHIRLKKDCLYYLNCENPDNLKYVEGYFRKYLQSNKIKTVDNIDHADAIITGHSVNIDGGLLFYMTVCGIDGTLLWMSEPRDGKKYKFERSVKSAVKKSCCELANSFKTKVKLPISSPLHPNHGRISISDFSTPDYSAAIRYYQMDNYKAAVKCFDKVIKEYPYFADAYYYRSIARCAIRDINDGKDDMMYFHRLSPFDERFDEGVKYVYHEIALRSERRLRNAQIFAGVANAAAQGIANMSAIASGNNSMVKPIPVTTVGTSMSTSSAKKRICSICHGTGKSLTPSTVAQYGQTTYQYCDICKSTGTPHYHKVCPSCLGRKTVNY